MSKLWAAVVNLRGISPDFLQIWQTEHLIGTTTWKWLNYLNNLLTSAGEEFTAISTISGFVSVHGSAKQEGCRGFSQKLLMLSANQDGFMCLPPLAHSRTSLEPTNPGKMSLITRIFPPWHNEGVLEFQSTCFFLRAEDAMELVVFLLDGFSSSWIFAKHRFLSWGIVESTIPGPCCYVTSYTQTWTHHSASNREVGGWQAAEESLLVN